MVTFLSILAVGFLLGMRHATDPDHVVAVTTIVSNQRTGMRAVLIGAFWGLGHTVTIFVVGAGIILFNLVIPVRLGLSMELSVAVMLVVLGLANVAAFFRSIPEATIASAARDGLEGAAMTHTHEHSHGDFIREHAPRHDGNTHAHRLTLAPLTWFDGLFGKAAIYQYLRPLLVGIVHGLAGSAAVALLILTTIRDSHWALAYLLVFGVGTIAGMMLITMGIASTFKLVTGQRQNLTRNLAVASGFLSIAFGAFVAYQICAISGLFSAHARWTPH